MIQSNSYIGSSYASNNINNNYDNNNVLIKEANELCEEIGDLVDSIYTNFGTHECIQNNVNSPDNCYNIASTTVCHNSPNCYTNNNGYDVFANELIRKQMEKEKLIYCNNKLNEIKSLLENIKEPEQTVKKNGTAWEIDENYLKQFQLKLSIQNQQELIRERLNQADKLKLSDYYNIHFNKNRSNTTPGSSAINTSPSFNRLKTTPCSNKANSTINASKGCGWVDASKVSPANGNGMYNMASNNYNYDNGMVQNTNTCKLFNFNQCCASGKMSNVVSDYGPISSNNANGHNHNNIYGNGSSGCNIYRTNVTGRFNKDKTMVYVKGNIKLNGKAPPHNTPNGTSYIRINNVNRINGSANMNSDRNGRSVGSPNGLYVHAPTSMRVPSPAYGPSRVYGSVPSPNYDINRIKRGGAGRELGTSNNMHWSIGLNGESTSIGPPNVTKSTAINGIGVTNVMGHGNYGNGYDCVYNDKEEYRGYYYGDDDIEGVHNYHVDKGGVFNEVDRDHTCNEVANFGDIAVTSGDTNDNSGIGSGNNSSNTNKKVESGYYKFDTIDDLMKYENDEYYCNSMGPLPQISTSNDKLIDKLFEGKDPNECTTPLAIPYVRRPTNNTPINSSKTTGNTNSPINTSKAQGTRLVAGMTRDMELNPCDSMANEDFGSQMKTCKHYHYYKIVGNRNGCSNSGNKRGHKKKRRCVHHSKGNGSIKHSECIHHRKTPDGATSNDNGNNGTTSTTGNDSNINSNTSSTSNDNRLTEDGTIVIGDTKDKLDGSGGSDVQSTGNGAIHDGTISNMNDGNISSNSGIASIATKRITSGINGTGNKVCSCGHTKAHSRNNTSCGSWDNGTDGQKIIYKAKVICPEIK